MVKILTYIWVVKNKVEKMGHEVYKVRYIFKVYSLE